MADSQNLSQHSQEEKQAVLESLDDALSRLPTKYREILVLHYIEEVPQKDLAELLGLKPSAASMRLTRAREKLRSALRRSGKPVAGSLLLAVLGGSLTASASPAFTQSIVGAAAQAHVAGLASAGVSAEVVSLTQGALKAMFLKKLGLTAAALVPVVCATLIATTTYAQRTRPMPRPMPAPAPMPGVPVAGNKPAKPSATPQINVGKVWQEAPIICVAKLNWAQEGPSTMSMPPIHSTRLSITVKEVLRGSIQKDAELQLNHSIRGHRIAFPVGKDCIIAMNQKRNYYVAKEVQEATKSMIQKVRDACSVPIGWTGQKGKLVSPWASLGAKAWQGTKAEGPRCSKTGRPLALVGPGIALSVTKVPPARDVKWSNPDGDGEYTIRLTNTTDKSVKIPALYSKDGKILWNESVVIVCQKKTYMAPGAEGVPADWRVVELSAGKSIETKIHALRLKGPRWPRGGYRIEFQFCVGELSQVMSFYYRSKHHDPIRKALK